MFRHLSLIVCLISYFPVWFVGTRYFIFLGVFVLLLKEPSFFRSAMVGDKEVGGDLPTIADDLVVTKYKMAAEIVNSKFLPRLVPCSVLDTLDSDVGVVIT